MTFLGFPIIRWGYLQHQWSLTTILASLTVFSGTVTQYSGCSHSGGWLWTLVMKTVSSTELLRLPPSNATICRTILEVCTEEWQEAAFNAHLLFCKEKCLKTWLRGRRREDMRKRGPCWLTMFPASISEPDTSLQIHVTGDILACEMGSLT